MIDVLTAGLVELWFDVCKQCVSDDLVVSWAMIYNILFFSGEYKPLLYHYFT